MPNTLEETETLAAANNILSSHEITLQEQRLAEEVFDGILEDWKLDQQENDNG